MIRKRRPKGDPIEYEIELALNPGAFISYDACFSFVSDLDEVITRIAKLKRDLLTKLGRGDEALDAVWSDYRKHPSAYTYDDLMKYVPKAQQKHWHEKGHRSRNGR